jgi:hypothetical protein
MTDLFHEREMSGFPSQGTPVTCCPSAEGRASSCCNPVEPSQKRNKALVSAIIILAAIAVGAYSLFRGNSAQSYTTAPVKSFSAGLTEVPTTAAENTSQSKAQTKPQEVSLNRVLDSLKPLDTLAADKDVVFVVLHAEAQNAPSAIPQQVGTVANNLWKSGQRIAVFTLKSTSPDHSRLVRHFSVNTLPCVVVLGRQGTASAVSGDISEARLYQAFVSASKPGACCPSPSTAACCPR